MSELKDKVNNSKWTRVLASIIMSFFGTIGIAIFALPYYLGYIMFKSPLWKDWQAWTMIGVWTWFILAFAIGMVMKWMEQGEENARKKKLEEITRNN